MQRVNLEEVIDLVGNIPISNLECGRQVVENFRTASIAVCITNRSTNISRGIHSHDSYEFVICNTDIPSAICDDTVYDRFINTMFAINPMQEHGMASEMKGFSLIGIHFDKAYMQGVADEIFGSPYIKFSNKSSAVCHDVNMLLSLYMDEIKYDQVGREFAIENLSLILAGYFIRHLQHNLPARPHNIPERNISNIKKVLSYMNENYTSGMSCAEMADLVKMDRYGFIRSFKANTGKTPYEYLLDLKIEKAKKMLMSKDYSITEISMMCDFSSHSHFTTTFKKKTGISPSEYRKSLNI